MGDDERRAEIETVARAWWAYDPRAFDTLMSEWRALQMRRAEAAIAALDRARDARRDDEATRSPLAEFQEGLTRALNRHGVPGMPSWDAAIDWLAEHGAQSPQGEDHERGIEVAAEELARWRPVNDTAMVARAVVATYLSRVSPSPERDTVRLREALDLIAEAEETGRQTTGWGNRARKWLAEFPDAPARDARRDTVAVEARAILRDVARTRRSDAWGVVATEVQQFLDEHPEFGSRPGTDEP